MPRPEDLKLRPRLGLERPRRLLGDGRSAPLPEAPPKPEEEASEVFLELETTRGKADDLLASIKRALLTLSVPVREEDSDVRAAVERKDPPSQGRFITFELYERALEFEADSFELEPGELAPLLTGHRYTDAKHLQALSVSKGTKLSAKDVALMLSQIMHLYVLQLMQMGFQAMESEKQTATKIIPPASEVPSATSSMVLSIAFQLAYSANHLAQMFDVLKESAGNALKPSQVNLDGAFAEAKKLKLPELRALSLALRSKDPEDYELIRDYARAFVLRTRKVGYEPWLLADDVFQMRQNLRRSLKQRSRYLGRGVPLSEDAARLLRYRSSRYSKALDHLGTALTETDPPSGTLCSIQWLGRLDPRPLDLLRATLEFLLESKATGLGTQLPRPELSFGGPLMEEIAHDLLEMMAKVSKKLLCWFKKDPEIWALLEHCPQISEMLDASIHGMDLLEAQVFQMLDSHVRGDRSLVYAMELKAWMALEMKKARMMLRKLAYVRAAAATSRDVSAHLRERPDLDREVFGGKTRIDLEVKDKKERPGDFVRQPSKSAFLSKISGEKGAEVQVVVPFSCEDHP